MDSIQQCNKLFQEKTLHPLASVIDLSQAGGQCQPRGQHKACQSKQVCPDSYCIMVLTSCCDGQEYGLRSCDFRDGTLLFSMPSKTVDISLGNAMNGACSEGRMVLFHPNLLVGTPLGRHISSFPFFKYRKDEAAHVSATELRDVMHIIDDIEHELRRGIDDYSARILSNDIELMLNYCLRFYNRQFIMRHDACIGELARFKSLVDDYLTSGSVRRTGLQCSACRFSRQMNMSAAYLNDLVRKATGKDVDGYAQLRRVELAKQMIVSGAKSDAKVALALGYANAGEFRDIFQRLTGVTTDQYR